jgi:hypothetical protein
LENTPREDSLFYDGRYPKSRIVNLLRSTAFNFGMVVEDHQSMKGVILDWLGILSITLIATFFCKSADLVFPDVNGNAHNSALELLNVNI